jgi:hypothetical protein
VQTGFANVDATATQSRGPGVTGSTPVNVLLGGVGNDYFIYNSSTQLTTDMVNGGPGIDTLRFASTVAAGQTLLDATVFVEAIEIATTGRWASPDHRHRGAQGERARRQELRS